MTYIVNHCLDANALMPKIFAHVSTFNFVIKTKRSLHNFCCARAHDKSPSSKLTVISVQFERDLSGSVAGAQKSCRDWIKQTIVFIVDLFCCFVSVVSRSVVLIQSD